MDTRNDNAIEDRLPLAELSRQRVIVGAKRLCKALHAGQAQKVFLAKDADPAITEPIAALCQQHHVAYAWVKSKTCLGRACGIEVGAAAAAIVSGSDGETRGIETA